MSLPIERTWSDEDSSLLEAHQLGVPLAIYGLRTVYFWTLRAGSFFALSLGIGLFICVPVLSIVQWSRGQRNGEPEVLVIGFLLLIGLSIFLVLAGLYILCIELPRAHKRRVLACESGLLLLGQGAKYEKWEVIRWSDILAIDEWNNPYGKCMIRLRENKVITLDSMYQNIDDLIEMIRSYTEKR